MGVRWIVTTKGHPSYLRGALTGTLAIVAFVVGQYAVAEVATRRGNVAKPITIERDAAANDATEAAAEGAEATLEPAQLEARPDAGAADGQLPRRQQFSTGDFIWLCIAALVAYELGRGSGGAPASTTTETSNVGGPTAPNHAMPPSD
jgi:hypothetical protein